MSYRDAVAALDRRSNYERTGRLTSPTLARMAALMDVMAHPQRTYQVLHVTGTVGKTTVASAASEVLRAAGLAVGTYTSPHVESVRERFWYDGRPITEAEFARAWEEVSPYLALMDEKGDQPVTWFEAATALAFSWFAEKAVDVAVVEVGLGGRWDATNVADGAVAVVTPIGLDHTGVLGTSPADIAREKAGIIKRGAIVYTAAQQQEVADVLRARTAELASETRAEGLAFGLEQARLAVGGQQIAMRLGRDRYQGLYLPMFGEHAARDAVLGAAAARGLLGDTPLEQSVLAEAFARLRLPARMEVVRRHPLVVLDGAHNPAAAAALADAMPASFQWERLAVVISTMADKDIDEIVGALTPMADVVIATRNASPRAAEPERIAAAARAASVDAMIVPDVADAIAVAMEGSGDDDCVLVTGSLYTAGDARAHLSLRTGGSSRS